MIEQDIPLEVAAKKKFIAALKTEGFQVGTYSITVETTAIGVATCSATDQSSGKMIACGTLEDGFVRMTQLLNGQELILVNTVYN